MLRIWGKVRDNERNSFKEPEIWVEKTRCSRYWVSRKRDDFKGNEY